MITGCMHSSKDIVVVVWEEKHVKQYHGNHMAFGVSSIAENKILLGYSGSIIISVIQAKL